VVGISISSAGLGTDGAGGEVTGVAEFESESDCESGIVISSAGFGAVTVGREGVTGDDPAAGAAPDDDVCCT
jgi:hypothetical protein